MGIHHHQIGEVAERTGLSLRTIRYYEEVGLVTPSSRSQGGFRLYTQADVARLELVMRMKPLDFSLDEMRELLTALDVLAGTPSAEERVALLALLERYRDVVDDRCRRLRDRLDSAEQFASSLRGEIRHLRHHPEGDR
ncbi:MerR family transcriptional regulator [Cellulomonas sp. APG4]|uniref:MerR family transcriptional regulator n=1 Tax=Cellulomonas sp. APG4 TaxID=1538656 RepID=UPI00137ABBD1|nr:MerR family transcriptional regulator [Cellulomonas sp. APG4]